MRSESGEQPTSRYDTWDISYK